jgi:hypothetical protein
LSPVEAELQPARVRVAKAPARIILGRSFTPPVCDTHERRHPGPTGFTENGHDLIAHPTAGTDMSAMAVP